MRNLLHKKSGLHILCSLLFLFLPAAASAITEEQAVQKALELSLHKDPYWRLLVHYKRALFGWKSLIDDPEFFLAPNGKRNPKAELEYTVRALFRPKEGDELHPGFKFIARASWLRGKLGISSKDLPYDAEEEYQRLKANINPTDFYLVFPACYLNNPASLFGHVFFLIESKDVPHLAGFSLNYGAVTTDPPGPIFAVKGLFGLYRGRYELAYYFKMITEYRDLDMRDIWEYRLNLTDEQKDLMLRHMIELNYSYSNYYYLDENCAYCLLFPIEAARPDTKLTSRFFGLVEPVRTINTMQKLGLLDEPVYRPSLFTTLQYRKQIIPRSLHGMIKKVCYGKASIDALTSSSAYTALTAEEKTNLWTFASEYLQYLLNNSEISAEDYRDRFLAVLTQLNTKSSGKSADTAAIAQVPVPDAQPQHAHSSRYIAAGGGYDSKEGPYTDISFRLLAHGLMDTDDGYSRNSQMEFFTGNIRYDINDNSCIIKKLDIAEFTAMPVSDSFIFKTGIMFTGGFESNTLEDKQDDLAGYLKLCFGASTLMFRNTQLYLYLGGKTYVSPDYAYNTDPLLGGEAGIITTAGILKQHLKASVYQSPRTFRHTRFALSAEECLRLTKDFHLTGSCTFNGDWRRTWLDADGSIRILF